MNRSYGMKIWSVNIDWIDDIIKEYPSNSLRFIELFAVPDSFLDTHKYWGKIKDANVKVIIHGVHSSFNVNWADKNLEIQNKEKATDSFKFADFFDTDIVIFHPGGVGEADESIRQLSAFNDKRIVIENKPYTSKFDNTVVFRGTSPLELKKICDETGYGCCIDFAHAICSSNSRKTDIYQDIHDYLKLDYRVCHLSDNFIDNFEDTHLRIGDGNYDFANLLKMVKKDVYLTLETPKQNLKEHIEDVEKLIALDKA